MASVPSVGIHRQRNIPELTYMYVCVWGGGGGGGGGKGGGREGEGGGKRGRRKGGRFSMTFFICSTILALTVEAVPT